MYFENGSSLLPGTGSATWYVPFLADDELAEVHAAAARRRP